MKSDHPHSALLKKTGVEVHPGEFVIVSVSREDWSNVLQDNSLSPTGDHPFMIFSEVRGVTLVLHASDFERIGTAIGKSRFEHGFRLITFTVEMDCSVTGFLADVSAILAAAKIPIFTLSSFSRDHLLVRQSDLANALKALGPHVESLC